MSEKIRFLQSFLVEVAVYAVLVAGYFLVVLHFLAGWVEQLYHEDLHAYAFVAILLMIGQGVVLELLTTALLRLIRARS